MPSECGGLLTSFNIPQSAADKATTLTQCMWLFESLSFKYKLKALQRKKEKKKKKRGKRGKKGQQSSKTHQVVSPELVTIWLSSRKRQQDKYPKNKTIMLVSHPGVITGI